jgi:hypothetical protein
MSETTSAWVLGVDFGRIHTAAAVQDRSGAVHEVELSDSGTVMPSAVYHEPDGRIVVGDRAIQAGLSDPEQFTPYPMDAIVPRDLSSPSDFSAVRSPDVAAVLDDVCARARRINGAELPPIRVLAYPDIQSAGLGNPYGASLVAAGNGSRAPAGSWCRRRLRP